MKHGYIADIGLEVHAELLTQSKMFCSCPVVDLTRAEPNTAVCPVCAGLPGTLPVVNEQAVEDAIRVALSLDCTIAHTSQFARKNYFYPDLPKGYQISQYDLPLAECGILPIRTDAGWLNIRIRRVHMEEDTAKLTHIHDPDGENFSLVDLNRAGIPLLEIVSEPDMHTIEQVRAYTRMLRRLLQYLGVNSGNLEKGVIRFEANVSLRPAGTDALGTRVEIKNLNSFRSMTTAIVYELERQAKILDSGGEISQQTLGWDETREQTFSQRSKEEAHDYRYFPEPDLPPLKINEEQIDALRESIPERPDRRFRRFVADFGLVAYQADLLTVEKAVADFFEATLTHMASPEPGLAANWILGELFGLLNATGESIADSRISPAGMGELLDLLQEDNITAASAKIILSQMVETGKNAAEIMRESDLGQVSDPEALADILQEIMAENPEEVEAYRQGKTVLRAWFFGQVMQRTSGRADPRVVQALLDDML
ncbi:MAG: Asp-tRNA(Asn)/Glu-tRNA(Gln) amidotransferase subunit GatB [Brevefilum sp.]